MPTPTAVLDTERQNYGEPVTIGGFSPVRPFTLSVWFKRPVLTGTYFFLCSSDAGSNSGVSIAMDTSNRIYGAIRNGYQTANASATANTLTHAVLVGGGMGTTPKLFINGTQQTTGSSGPITAGGDGGLLTIAGRNGGAWAGAKFGEVRLYDQELSGDEVAALYALGPGRSAGGPVLKRYIMPCFTQTQEALQLLTSDDGETWSRYPHNWTAAPSVRDSRYWYDWKRDKHMICYTDGGFSVPHSQFVVIEAPNPAQGERFEFSLVANVDCSAIGGGLTQQTWGPKFYFDPVASITRVYFSGSLTGNSGPFQIYETHPTNSPWTTWSTPVQVTGTALPANTIDGEPFYYEVGQYFFLTKDEATGYPHLVMGTGPTSGFDTAVRSGNFLGVGQCEGFSVQRFGQKWRVYFDDYRNAGFMKYIESSSLDLTTCTFGPAVAIVSPVQSRNGGIYDRFTV